MRKTPRALRRRINCASLCRSFLGTFTRARLISISTLFSQLNAPGVYFKLGTVDRAFQFESAVYLGPPFFKKGFNYHSFYLAAVYLALES